MRLTVDQAKKILDDAPSNAEYFCNGYYFRFEPEFMFHNGIHPVWNITDNDGAYFKNKSDWNPIKLIDLMVELYK